MKIFIPLLLLSILIIPCRAQESNKISSEQSLMAGYSFDGLGQGYHLSYGYSFGKNMIYGGLLFHQNQVKAFKDENRSMFRSGGKGKTLGFSAGFQRYFWSNNSLIQPLWAVDLSYAYLNSYSLIYGFCGNVSEEPETADFFDQLYLNDGPQNLWQANLDVGFEARVFKGIFLKPTFGCALLLRQDPYSANLMESSPALHSRLSLGYRF